ncbi:MAG: 2-oxoacid:acceptor oxidoreductase family protein [Nitrospirae bacterium]|nr:2-oxoacid:acceptor oxidoreductase family protein [Nitrospirota bacterium]MCL5976754.1 2-oxoacid:acceptor oxidoreductase family protein [Nitrospirota bacterium]
METRIIIAGSGGQGVLFLGKLICYSGMFEGKEVTWFPSYGAEMRGGTANCTVIVSDEMIGSPVIRNPDILIAMNKASYERFSERLLGGGTLIYDSSLFTVEDKHENGINVKRVPAAEMSASFKNTKSANMVMLGAFVFVSRIFNINSALQAIDEITPDHRKKAAAVNKDLIMKGYKLLEDKKG